MTATQLAQRSLRPVVLATAGMPPRLRLARLRGAERDRRVPPQVWVREVYRAMRRAG